MACAACEVTGKQGPAPEGSGALKDAEKPETSEKPETPEQPEKPEKPETPEKPEKPEVVGETPKPPPAGAMAKLLEGSPLPVADMIGKAPPEAQKRLGEPTGKGMARESCVRFVPKRTWFECKYAYQRYEDTTGKFKAIQMTFEDGISTGIAYEWPKGEGDFDPVAALRFVGLELPGEPKVQKPKPNVEVWAWGNDAARLVLDGKQYRVTVSTVDGKWEHSKVEVMINHPLTEAQKAKVKTTDKPKGNAPAPK